MLVPLLLAALILVIAVGAYVWLGPEKFAAAWARIPGPWRTVLNLALASLLAYGGPELITAINGSDIPAWLQPVLVLPLTVLIRSANPADGPATGGYGKVVQDEVVAPAEGDHEGGQE
jgi:hypothetical protein